MNLEGNNDIITIIENIKKDILSTRNSILRNANKELIEMYSGLEDA